MLLDLVGPVYGDCSTNKSNRTVLKIIQLQSTCKVILISFSSTVVRCPEPPSIPNGEILLSSNTTVAGTVVEYACSSRRYRLVGPKQIVCLPNGHYDSKPPVCKGKAKNENIL